MWIFPIPTHMKICFAFKAENSCLCLFKKKRNDSGKMKQIQKLEVIIPKQRKRLAYKIDTLLSDLTVFWDDVKFLA